MNSTLLFMSSMLTLSAQVLADCSTPITAAKVPSFIEDSEIDAYLQEERQRQQALCNNPEKSLGSDKAIYVQDNRVDAYRAIGAIRHAANATAALIESRYMRQTQAGYEIILNASLRDTGWCASEPFSDQPISAYCTAFLVDKDILVTAGHCVRNAGRTVPHDQYHVVFGFQMQNRNEAKTRFAFDDVYRVIDELEVKKNSTEDWAVLRLDRPVRGRQIFEFASDEIATGTQLTIFGYPNGLPLKIADGGSVKKNLYSDNVFVSDLDSYRGNSGSPVLNTNALKRGRFVVEGILVAGAQDSENRNGCKVSMTCQSARVGSNTGICSGEQVTKINRVVAMDTSAMHQIQASEKQNQVFEPSTPSLPDELKGLITQ